MRGTRGACNPFRSLPPQAQVVLLQDRSISKSQGGEALLSIHTLILVELSSYAKGKRIKGRDKIIVSNLEVKIIFNTNQ